MSEVSMAMRRRRRIRQLFNVTGHHRFVPDSTSDQLRHIAYLTDVSKWIHEHEHLEVGDTAVELFAHLLSTQGLHVPINYLEFGVASGQSLRWWCRHNTNSSSRFVGFDTFTGLPDDWDNVPKGSFSQGGTPANIDDSRCSFEVGLFKDTLHSFIESFSFAQRNVVYLDADLYTSTLFVLSELVPFLNSHDIIIMDDFCSLNHPTHVFRAWDDYVATFDLKYRFIATSNMCAHVGVELL